MNSSYKISPILLVRPSALLLSLFFCAPMYADNLRFSVLVDPAIERGTLTVNYVSSAHACAPAQAKITVTGGKLVQWVAPDRICCTKKLGFISGDCHNQYIESMELDWQNAHGKFYGNRITAKQLSQNLVQVEPQRYALIPGWWRFKIFADGSIKGQQFGHGFFRDLSPIYKED